MPIIMGLEGPRNTVLDDIRAELYASTPRAVYRASVELAGMFDPVRSNKLLAIGAVVLGAWLAGSSRGQRFVRRWVKR